MPIDPYSSCPGGKDKKIKFCCPDLLAELDKIEHMIEAEQRVACLEYIEKLESKFPDRACLMNYKGMLQMSLGEHEKASATMAAYEQKHPDNPVALAEMALLKAQQEGGTAAVEPLQRALAASGREMPSTLYDAIGMTARALMAEGAFMAARAHLMLQLGITGAENEEALALISRMDASPGIPLLLKQEGRFQQPPDDALWKRSYNEALSPAMRGAWRLAIDKLASLAEKVGDWPAIWGTIAVLRAWLADNPGTVEALRKFVAQQVPLDDAVEAEALAQLLDDENDDQIDVLTLTYPVNQWDALAGKLATHPLVEKVPVDLSQLGSEEAPPPKGLWLLLDRVIPESASGLSIKDIPKVVGQVSLFGKQTDREARLELVTHRGEELDRARQSLSEMAGDAIGSAQEEVTSQVSALAHALSLNWRLPLDVSTEQRNRWISEQRRELLLNVWPNLPQKQLGGRTPALAAPEASSRVKLSAAILLLETAPGGTPDGFDFNVLRRQLGLPTADPIDPWQVSVAEVPLARLARLDVVKLSDEDLVHAFRRADHFRHTTAIHKLGHEILARRSLDKKIDKADIYGALSHVETDPQKAIALVGQARQIHESAGKSSAPWDLMELSLHLAHGDGAEVGRLLNHLRTEHIKEPGVAQALFQMMVHAGVVHPDGTPVAAPAREAAPTLVVPGAETSEPGKLWTPETAHSSGKKSTIWTPD